MNQVVNKHRTQELISGVKTLNREIRLLQAERKSAPTFSFRHRTKIEIAEEICRLEDRRAEYVRRLNEAKRGQPESPTQVKSIGRNPVRPSPAPATLQAKRIAKARMQHEIDSLYREIGKLGARIAEMPRTPARRLLINQHQSMIQRRRQLISEISRA